MATSLSREGLDQRLTGSGINFERLYEFRFRDVDEGRRRVIWREIAAYIYKEMGTPASVLDPAAGRGEFISAVPAPERWAVDLVAHADDYGAGVRTVIADIFDAELPEDHFQGVFVSNFLEHLATQSQVADFLAKMYRSTAPGGVITILGPNFKYCASEYFDCADHVLALTHVSVEEHLYAAGFRPTKVHPRFLPFSFRGNLPTSATLTRAYLRTPMAWRILGKQFLLFAQRP